MRLLFTQRLPGAVWLAEAAESGMEKLLDGPAPWAPGVTLMEASASFLAKSRTWSRTSTAPLVARFQERWPLAAGSTVNGIQSALPGRRYSSKKLDRSRL